MKQIALFGQGMVEFGYLELKFDEFFSQEFFSRSHFPSSKIDRRDNPEISGRSSPAGFFTAHRSLKGPTSMQCRNSWALWMQAQEAFSGPAPTLDRRIFFAAWPVPLPE
ncbi:MAG: hypothetical protein GY850_30540 [bacterium]|nr:hypothetical protein [bacterium]